MKPSELATPIRIYWDVGPASSVTPADGKRISEDIAANKILYLQLTETSQELSPTCVAALDALKDKALALSLVAPVNILTPQALEVLGKYPLKAVFAQTDSFSDLQTIGNLSAHSNGKPMVGISYSVTRENFQDLPRVLVYCVEHRIPHLLVPMQRLVAGETCFSFSKHERMELMEKLRTIEKPSWLKITIHDPFLWRAFYPSVEFPNGGCQAANTMLYVSANADVYACPMLTVRIGNLLEAGLKDIITGDRKKDLRKQILDLPAICTVCEEVLHCNGGCRGRAYSLSGLLKCPDPACK